MVCRTLCIAIVLAALPVLWSVGPGSLCHAQVAARHRAADDLFYNYYVPPGDCGGVAAQLYLCPRSTPPLVGRTYITYQPLMPHEFLYRHQRLYQRQNSSGWTTTKVMWW